jgi:hypothetical protein
VQERGPEGARVRELDQPRQRRVLLDRELTTGVDRRRLEARCVEGIAVDTFPANAHKAGFQQARHQVGADTPTREVRCRHTIRRPGHDVERFPLPLGQLCLWVRASRCQ